MSFILTQTPTVIFTVMGLLHFLVSVLSLFVSSECPLTLLVGLSFGGIFVPTVLIFLKLYNRLYVKNVSLAVGSLIIGITLSAFIIGCFAFGIRILNTLCHERLLFMAFVHGIIIPGVIVTCASMTRMTKIVPKSQIYTV